MLGEVRGRHTVVLGELGRGEVGSAIEADDLADDAAESSAGTAVRPVSVSRLRRFKSLHKSEACW